MNYYVNENIYIKNNELSLCEIIIELNERCAIFLLNNKGNMVYIDELIKYFSEEEIRILEQYGIFSLYPNNYNLIPNLSYSFFNIDARCFLEEYHLKYKRVGVFEIPYYSGVFKDNISMNSMWDLKMTSLKVDNPNISVLLNNEIESTLPIIDYGFLNIAERDTMIKEIFSLSYKVFSKNEIIPLFIGGDHSITYPIIDGLIKSLNSNEKLYIIHFDAHSNLKNRFNKLMHLNVMDKVLQFKNVEIINLGLRGIVSKQEKMNIEAITLMDNIDLLLEYLKEIKGERIYLSVDLSVFDTSFISSVNYPVAGGITFKEFNDFLEKIALLNIKILGVDVVEYNSEYDSSRVSAINVCYIIYQLLKYLSR